MAKKERIDPEELLREAEERQVGVSLPLQISRRLDRLVSLANSEGLRVFRKDLVAALVLAAEEDPKKLADLVLELGKAKNRDAMAPDERRAEILQFDRPRPGRRPRRS
jgi:hypothetical protein